MFNSTYLTILSVHYCDNPFFPLLLNLIVQLDDIKNKL